MFIITDPIGKNKYYPTDIKTAADIIVGITGEEKDYEEACEVMSDMMFGDRFSNGIYAIECVKENNSR